MMPRQPSVPKVISTFATVFPILAGSAAARVGSAGFRRRSARNAGRPDAERAQTRLQHFADQLLEADLRPPAKPGASLGRVATQVGDLGRTEGGAIEFHVT